jgi:hypothetical protein
MTKDMLISFTLTAGLLIWAHTGNAHAVVSPSLAQVTMQALVDNAGIEYCYWKQKRSGKLKLKCKD